MSFESPFHRVPPQEWIASNELAFAFYDRFPVTAGHTLVVTRRLIPNWFAASAAEQAALMQLVNEVRDSLSTNLSPRPDGFNVGFNDGMAAGQTVAHVHIHVIPRYHGDVADPRGGVRYVIPEKANYLATKSPKADKRSALSLSKGHPSDPLWQHLAHRLQAAREVDILAAFVQISGLILIEKALFEALSGGAEARILVGDYLYISDPVALDRLLGWAEMINEKMGEPRLQVRLAITAQLLGQPKSFHPKAWRLVDESGGLVVVGSSNLSSAALKTGVEWNLIAASSADSKIQEEIGSAFKLLWDSSTPLSADLIEGYRRKHQDARRSKPEPEQTEKIDALPDPRPWQQAALEQLNILRGAGHCKALIAVATGLGKTWLAGFDLLNVSRELGRIPSVLVIAHRAEILAQAESVLHRAIQQLWPDIRVTRYLGAASEFDGDIVIASVQKLSRPAGLKLLEQRQFDYCLIDEVHHADATSYRRILAFLQAEFLLGLTATPERSDGVDVSSLFDDVLAYQATIGDGIHEGSLVPFHYIGLKDAINYEPIPWRNGRFDTELLERELENSARMNRLWAAWQKSGARSTIVFCASIRHALFTRNWLLAHGVSTAAIFSGKGSDSRSDSMDALTTGHLDALCVVDLFNEGVDIPSVDRIIMLRPTESKVIFIQQLGRGLRAAEGKTRLEVIDFVGNHRLFGQRLIHLMSLCSQPSNWSGLKAWLDGDEPILPPGCMMDVDLEAKDILRKLLPVGSRAALEAYRAMRDEMGVRPSMVEFFNRGYLPATLRAQHEHWFGFIQSEGDLTPEQSVLLDEQAEWLRLIETTRLNQCFKMIVLRVLLDRDALWTGMELTELATACRKSLLSHPQLRHDLRPNNEIPDHQTATTEVWTKWWVKWPVGRWLAAQNGTNWFQLVGGRLMTTLKVPEALKPAFCAMSSEIVEYRLAHYISTRLPAANQDEEDFSFLGKVSHTNGKPILFIPEQTNCPQRPVGPTEVRLPNGQSWEFRFVKVACNVATPKGTNNNLLAELLREWFGSDAGLPGTNFTVQFSLKDGTWNAQPTNTGAILKPENAEELPKKTEKALPFELYENEATGSVENPSRVPVYDLEAAAGSWGPEQTPNNIGWAQIEDNLSAGSFIAYVSGCSMEPRIPSGSWCLFRPVPIGSRQGRTMLVQFNSLADPENGGRYTVKIYHSEKTIAEDGWQHQYVELRPLNPDFEAITITEEIADELLVVGEFVRVLV